MPRVSQSRRQALVALPGRTSTARRLPKGLGASPIARDATDLTPHAASHDRAMHLLQSGVDITVIALWLGYENTATTHQYVEADLAMKEAALRCVDDPAPQPLRFTATDRLLDFLEAL